MSWFDEQLRYRNENDNQNFNDAIDSIASAVMGKQLTDALSDKKIADSAIEEILKYYNFKLKTKEIPDDIETVEERLDYMIRPFGIMYRAVDLDNNWYKYSTGAMLGTLKKDGSVVALIPGKFSGYFYMDIKTGKRIKINRKTQKLLDTKAVCFYCPLPQRTIKIYDLIHFMIKQLNLSDVFLFIGAMAFISCLGLLTPIFTKWLFGKVLMSGSTRVLLSLAVFMSCFSICRLCFSIFQSLVNSKVKIKQNIALQAAVMNRIMNLPPSFFKKYASGELTQRAQYIQTFCSTLFDTVGTTGLTSVFSLIYIGQIFAYAPELVLPSVIITFSTIIISLLTTFIQMKITREKMQISTKTSGMTYSAITGIQKIKLAGAEKRMFVRWAEQYCQEAKLEYDPPVFLKLSSTITLSISLFGTIILYFLAIKNNIKCDDYYAFNSAYGMISSAITSLSSIAVTIANIRPIIEMTKPIMNAEPEMIEDKEIITGLRGKIEFNNVSFRYDHSMPNVIDNISFKINSGEYVAVVGSTGCGKSTLVRLMLGFEKPQKGTIFYDRKNIADVDLKSLRQKIGVVTQDGKLFPGNIFSNISISAPNISVNDAWEAAETASIADDIRNMPMGMHTVISEGQGGISGGQKQRLMIARAVAPKPKILIFDEATSALDNITQKKISDAIDKLKCTRIIIAHRLSTIRHADRIILIHNGKIAEQGNYDELMQKNGLFSQLVSRQKLNTEEFSDV